MLKIWIEVVHTPMYVFFSSEISGENILFTTEEARHASALRIIRGEKIMITDGKGQIAEAIVEQTGREFRAKITSRKSLPPHSNLWIAIAPTKSMTRFEWFVEKAIEIGIYRITPLICARSERKTIKIPRLTKIAISALKQSGKVHLPVLDHSTPISEFFSSLNDDHKKLIAHLDEDAVPLEQVRTQKPVLILIGPEGDFTPTELESANEGGFQKVSLGKYRLRTETAGVIACIISQLKNSKTRPL